MLAHIGAREGTGLTYEDTAIVMITRRIVKMRSLRCKDFTDCVECTLRHCPNLEPVDPDEMESLYVEFSRAMDDEDDEMKRRMEDWE